MYKIAYSKVFLISCLAISLTLMIFPIALVVGQEGPFAGIKKEMAGISETERDNLENLFVWGQQIKELEKEEARFSREIERKNREIEGLKISITREEIAYTKKLADLKQVLKSYQRMGPGTYLEIILNSEDLATLLRKINTLRDITRNTGKLMDLLEESKAKQLSEKANLEEKATLLLDTQKQLREAMTKKMRSIEDQEKYLASLQEKRKYYQENLTKLQQNWDELKTSVPEIIKELSIIIDEGYIPPEKLNISYNFMRIKGAIDENTLNEIISGYPSLPKIVFNFYPSKVEIWMPEKNLLLSGIFLIQEAHTIKFQVKEGSFYGMPLDTGSIEDLFLKGDLVFKLKLPQSNFTINSIKTTDGYLEFTISPNTKEAQE